jgi:hypothetical protein
MSEMERLSVLLNAALWLQMMWQDFCSKLPNFFFTASESFGGQSGCFNTMNSVIFTQDCLRVYFVTTGLKAPEMAYFNINLILVLIDAHK